MSILTKSQLTGFRNRTRTFQKSITESLSEFHSESKSNKVTIFLSHKHNEIEELDATISLLKLLEVDVYVDWQDEEMPKETSGITASRIKQKIRDNQKFIFLATEGAIASKWCNWELGYGDSQKYMKNIALFPIKNDNQSYSGSEYMQIYPSIEYVFDNDLQYNESKNYVPKGYYVLDLAINGTRNSITLVDWLNR